MYEVFLSSELTVNFFMMTISPFIYLLFYRHTVLFGRKNLTTSNQTYSPIFATTMLQLPCKLILWPSENDVIETTTRYSSMAPTATTGDSLFIWAKWVDLVKIFFGINA